ncbi:inactive peptidyl-prolyl cis-trans isomerase FKBP6-like [Ptychodera flava]|uniref:inactive peptidyl-prolyl cis-trans isomerase FKBP6-like n=1 Tax=Ptychodera flava TaxID=63121 RepID=UPI00396A279A
METPEPVPETQSLSTEDEDREPLHSVQIKGGLDLNELSRPDGEGAEFEIVEDMPPLDTDDQYFDSEVLFKQLNFECTAVDDDDPSTENLSPFERLAREMDDISGDMGVLKKMIKTGMGDIIPPSSHCKVHYSGYLEYSDEPYDSTRLRNKPHTCKLGEGMCIPGFEIAIASMRKGEFSRFLVKPEFAFGKHGCPPRIPGNAQILFEMELISYIDNSLVEDFHKWSKEDQRNASFDEILAVVHAERKAGNELYQLKHISRAFGRYNRAQRILENCHLKDEAEEKAMKKVMLKLCLNMALCSVKLCQSARAIMFCKAALEIDPQNVKGLFRYGQALHQLSEFDRAKDFFLRCQKIEPHNEEITKELRKLDSSVRKFKSLEKEMYGKMFASVKDKTKDDSGDVTKQLPKGCSPDFQKTVNDTFRTFIETKDMQEMPFSMVSFTTAEMEFVTHTASQMGLTVKHVGSKSDRFLKIGKKNMAEE